MTAFVERAGTEQAFLLRSPSLPCWYLIFPAIVVTPWVESK